MKQEPSQIDPWMHFTLGISVAYYIHSIQPLEDGPSRIINLLREVANGDTTLIDTADATWVARKFNVAGIQDKLCASRKLERSAAEELVQRFKS